MEGVKAIDLGERIGLSKPTSIYKYVEGTRIPRPEFLLRIYEETGGLVDANAFYGLPTRKRR